MEEEAKPIRQFQRRLNPHLQEVVRPEVLKLLQAGIIYPISDSPWVSPTQVVPKKSGITVIQNEKGEEITTRLTSGWRVCIDYRKLNAVTRKDHFPLPFIDQCWRKSLDIHSIVSWMKNAFWFMQCTCYISKMYLSIFSDMVERIMEVFMDDITVYGGTFEECLVNLEAVLHRCIEKDLVLNWRKCHFMVRQGIVLGHIISERGIEVDKAKVELIVKLPSPTTVKRLLAKDAKFIWDERCQHSFDQLKKFLKTTPIVRAPNWQLPFELMCDASDFAIGAMLGQREDGKPYVIYYASKTLNEAQRNYTTTEKELLAVQDAKARLIRWILLLQEFDLQIKDKKGVENVVADHLSRVVLKFLKENIFSRFGVPKAIISDGGLVAIKKLNMDLIKEGEKRFLDLNEMEEVRNNAYINSKVAKQRMKSGMINSSPTRNFRKGKEFCCMTQDSISFLGSSSQGG
ncbi:Retrovirus-related Pol polyprotein from transposon opus [Vitis vinifera]|uniref:Retrovirus-related Pol polyprotein from transposon opus n=1 Tax=Vitis vinifera TaxID=29760 RepID=A0A438CUA8_VITVI|nr:Retrovirus-related Pol polyprotein from transposon opus [Vitis vinifera]